MNQTNKNGLACLVALALVTLIVFLATGCSTTHIENAHFHDTTINTATWKSQAGVGEDATIDATTSPKTDASLTGL